jgi:small-conductance mechanosensitive channel
VETVLDQLHFDSAIPWIKATIYLLLAFAFARVGRGLARRLTSARLSAQHVMIAERLGYWMVLLLGFTSAMREVGFDLSVLLGAAGILTVAIGFASQTSASNLISGLFLLGERPFVVGDVIRLASGTTGEVVAIDLLSVKLRTFDNLLVRVPNETLLKSEIANLTHFRIRRIDLTVAVDYAADLPYVRQLLIAVAEAEPSVLDEPRPTIQFNGFGEAGMELQFSAWATTRGYPDAKNRLAERVKAMLDREGIAIPSPNRVLATAHGVPLEVVVRSAEEGGARGRSEITKTR